MIKLSYILTTYNKLEYLRQTLPDLISACKQDEEIIIVDGGSTDGTKEYAEELARQGDVHTFISEPDKGEAHGLNKAIFLSKGELLKIISDDDCFDYSIIGQCRQYMLENPAIDIVGTEGAVCSLFAEKAELRAKNDFDRFETWTQNRKPFIFTGLSLMIRKSSIAYIGLFDTQTKIIDFEYGYRITSIPCKLAFCSGISYVNIINPGSNSHNMLLKLFREKIELERIYLRIPSFLNKHNKDLYKILLYKYYKSIFKSSKTDTANVPYSQAYEFAKLELLKRKGPIRFIQSEQQ